MQTCSIVCPQQYIETAKDFRTKIKYCEKFFQENISGKMLQVLLVLVLFLVFPSKLDAVCPAGWTEHKNHCYKKFDNPASWGDARTSCMGENGDLADVKDAAENKFVKETFGGGNWLGFTGCQVNDICNALEFTTITWNNFAKGEPDDRPQTATGVPHNEFAVLNLPNGEWEDQPKSKEHSYICKKSNDPCENIHCNPDGGTCDRANGVCKCNPGFSGDECYITPCDNNPCKNGGTCTEVNNSYECKCVNHYSGTNCEVKPPCEAKKPCQHGVCEDISDVDYKCKCNPTWIGKNCHERPCDKRPCVNAKQCINEAAGFKCICLTGWSGPTCEKDGRGVGDPHYTTFDGKRYDFMGKCEYVYAKDCSSDHAFEVLQQNEACGGGTVSCTRSIRVLFQGKEVKLDRAGVVYVDGVRVKHFPWTLTGSTAKIAKYGGGARLDVPDLLFSVLWDGYMGINVKINQRYGGNMCGLMGNADGNPNNDFQLPDKSINTNIATFANSWKKNPRCVNGIVPPDPCKRLIQTKYNTIKEKCGKMKQSPFNQCNGQITPDIGYIPNCEYDLCAMKGNPSAAWCQALETYDKACTSKGVNIDWEGKAEFTECGDPCADMPCFNGAVCENINRKQFKCVCPTGFSGPTCKNVECKIGYVARGSVCYQEKTKRPWTRAKCPAGEEFVSAEDEDENKFIYEEFVKSSKKSFWMNARVCGIRKLCSQNFGAVRYHNFVGQFPAPGQCVEISYGKNGVWTTKNCKISSVYICKYRKENP